KRGRMKILLVRPHVSLAVARSFYAFVHLEPLDLEIVAGGIDRKHETRILDLTLYRRPRRVFDDEVRRFQPDIIGFGGYSTQARHVKELAASAKVLLPACVVMVGGVHATIAPVDYGLPGIIDVVVRGDGATVLRKLVAVLEAGGDAGSVPNCLVVKSPGFAELAKQGPPELPPISQIPRPRRDLTDRSRYYCIWSGEHGARSRTIFPRVATLRTSVGCAYRCKFCVVHFLAHGKYMPRAPEDVVDEIAALPEEHIYFVDDEMFINPRRARRVAELLLERGIRKQYISWARSDTICRNEGVFRLWKQAGLAVVYIGLESMEEQNLDGYDKQVTPAENRRAVAILRALRIGLHAALMVNPDFDVEDFRKIHKTIKQVAPAEMSFTVFSPSPGTPLWEEHRDEFICEDPYSFYDCMHTLLPTRLPLNRFYRYFSLLYLLGFRENPWRAKKVGRSLRDLARVIRRGMCCGWALRRIYKDYDRKYW
ncbi:MAG: radical SAM protein, partial [Kiritimatiellae bacterium]|nr:radical SAM protein [Kiritimatiellia bacterium]